MGLYRSACVLAEAPSPPRKTAVFRGDVMRLSNFRIRTRIYVGFGSVILVGLAVALAGIWQMTSFGREVDRLVTAGDTVRRSLQVNRLAEAMRRTSLGYQTK